MNLFSNKKKPILDEETAAAILNHVFEQCGRQPNSVPVEALSAYTVYRRERFYLQRGVLTVMLVLFFLLPFLFVRTQFEVQMQEPGVRKLPVYSVQVTSWPPTRSVIAVLRNRVLPVYEADAKRFTIEPTRNGMMEIEVASVNRQRSAVTIEVTDVDSSGPVLTGSSVIDDMVYLMVHDEGIGVSYDDIYGLTASGKVVLPAGLYP